MTVRKDYHKHISNMPLLGPAWFFSYPSYFPMKVFVDESGDLGWNFTGPYRAGGSSRYLTIGYLVLPTAAGHLPGRIVRRAYQKFNWRTSREKKGSELKPIHFDHFIPEVIRLLESNPGIEIGFVTVKKERVLDHIRTDANKLYNYMIGLAVLDKIRIYSNVELVRDERTIKVASGNSLIDYLQMKLWFSLGSETILRDNPVVSHSNLNILFIDWLCHAVWSNYEDSSSRYFQLLQPAASILDIYF